MKYMSRDFTLAERILLIFLTLVLLGLVYYRFVDQPVREAIASSQADTEMFQAQIDAVQARLLRLKGIKDKMDELTEKSAGNLSYMASYNNSNQEVNFLNTILADTLQYSISFGDVTRSGDQIRRNFTLQYQTDGYSAARKILLRLCNGKYRCLIGDIRCSIDASGKVTINGTATFYETMVGGTPDAGLPADTAAVKQ